MDGPSRLGVIRAQLMRNENVPPVTVREFLSWFGAQRRGVQIVWKIRTTLLLAGLATSPDFESAYIGARVGFILFPIEAHEEQSASEEIPGTASLVVSWAAIRRRRPTITDDPTHRISKLAAANNPPISIAPDAELKQAVTIMLANDFSQLPVMAGERDVKGVVTWASIGARLALGRTVTRVREVMEPHEEIPAESSLFDAIPAIGQFHYVLVRGSDSKITGIVTASDLSIQFKQLAEPFLLLGEIENHIRMIIDEKLTAIELAQVKDHGDDERKVESVEDLTFGEYIRLLEKPERWEKIAISLDRKTFCKQLDRVRLIRNDVMHFDPDGVTPEDLDALRDFSNFLRRLQSLRIV